MKKEETENLIKVMQAFLKGEAVEERVATLGNHTNWVTHTGSDWDTTTYEYRIKSKPQYRPFKDGNECWEEMQKHQPFGWIKIQDTYYNIHEVDIIDEKLYIGTCYYTLECAYDDITFADGTPFGVKRSNDYSLKSK